MKEHKRVRDELLVLDRLEVGPVRLEPSRFTAPYAVFAGGQRDVFELIFKYDEPVFDPEDPGSANLAAVAAAQAALNYGLFCKELVFRGPFDTSDRRFIEEMARNTAREIYVNKILAHNSFLRGPVADLPRVKLGDYLLARIVFDEDDEEHAASNQTPKKSRFPSWQTDRSKHAVSSSGGKDSLVTYAVLEEIGAEVHPIFVNESGRHWYTALNAYRHFEKNVANTARVWTNVDRLYTFMLRRLSFVRPDFASVRADIYPVRLWTVAVFLFAELPLLRKRGIGRLLVGNEIDTTVRGSYRGISHYAGLYDQSRFFDNALSRYFAQKRWNVALFSILRPLSELLIEKILVERYRDLARHQVSCHAGHIEKDRVLPCGKCEKCRRIMAMMVALGADPRLCGYDVSRVDEALAGLASFGLHQEQASVEQVLHMLAERGKVPPEGRASRSIRRRPEVLQLRFDDQRSPLDAIPSSLRKSVYSIYLEHADGALRRRGGDWVDFNPRKGEALTAPYRFEVARVAPGKTPEPSNEEFVWGQMTWPDAKRALERVDVALLPVGAIEQHGPHLPVDTDFYDADRLCREVAKVCSQPRPLVLPGIPYGVSYHHDDFAGTISISPSTLSQFVYEIGMAVARQGITKLIIVNGHGGNEPALQLAAQLINRDAHIFTAVDTGQTSDADVEALAQTFNDVHAGEIETSTALASRPKLVREDRIASNVPRFSSDYLEFSSKRGISWYAQTERISTDGVMGDPTLATVEKGEAIWDVMIRNLAALIEDIKSMSLDEIYQRRY